MNRPIRPESRILIVDDQQPNVLLLRRMLEREGYRLLHGVTDPRTAAVEFRSFKPDLILLDLQMPHADGFAVMAELAADRDAEGILPVLVLTADTTQQTRERALAAGASDFLTKPFEVTEVLLRVRNLLETRRLHLELRRANEELRRANRDLESFAHSASHDLQAPLRRMGGFVRMLMEDHGDALAPEVRANLDRISESAGRMTRLVGALLALSQSARKEMTRTTVDLSALARAICAELREGDPARQVEFVIADGLTAEGDEQLLRAALENLLRNAWKFTARTPAARIEFGFAEGAYFVRDNGAGFDPAQTHRLFTAFQRLHPADAFPGSGIGLAIVDRIVRRHGGRTWAKGAVGAGATFGFTLGGAAQHG